MLDLKTQGQNLVSAQPFFERIQLDIEASEPNERLGSREDLLSSLDALHEDLYFVGSDYFKNYGYEKCGSITDAPGLILPKIKKVNGICRMRVRVFSPMSDMPKLLSSEGCFTPEAIKREGLSLSIREIRWEQGAKSVVLAIDGVEDALLSSMAELANRQALSFTKKISGFHQLILESKTASYSIFLSDMPSIKKDFDIRNLSYKKTELLSYDEYLTVIEELKRVDGIQVYQTAVSYQGRRIFAIELAPKRQGYLSRTKRITYYPTEFINARHHANEVSATTSALMLLQTLLTDASYADLTESMNLVLIPMENVDGAVIHYELQKENPNWKLHVARFNAIGKEFYSEHFVPDTIHTEAIGLRRLFLRLLPDVLIDNHGVPSHEWEQPFSGYTSPSYKGFWLPRSLLYGYFFHIDEAEYNSNLDLCKKMEDVIAEAFLADPQINIENLMWAKQFEKYAHTWMPNMFPASYYKNMINYWIPSKYNPNHRYPSVRYPWILSVDYVSEVADETAQGDYLYSCARAHVVHDLAIIKLLMNCQKVYDLAWEYTDSTIRASITRKRPILVL